MSEFLSKEEIKQWRSSLEKITLEEYAARLGKKIAEDKHTNDLADIVMHGQSSSSMSTDWVQPKTERITTIAQRAFEREQEINPSPFSISKLKLSLNEFNTSGIEKKSANNKQDKTAAKAEKASASAKAAPLSAAPKAKTAKAQKAIHDVVSGHKTGEVFRDDVRIVFKKALTDREQKVFDYFAEHENEVVYAKDLAVLLDLPRDYVYKYIKNLRAKIEGEKLENADKGGFILHV